MKVFFNRHGTFVDQANRFWMSALDRALRRHWKLPSCEEDHDADGNYLCADKLVYVDISKAEERDRIRDLYCKGDFLIARLNQHRHKNWKRRAPGQKGWAHRHGELAATFGNDMFPNPNEAHFYDNKNLQRILFENKKYPHPKTIYAKCERDIAIKQLSGIFDFPLVRKEITGAGSKKVSMVKSLEEIAFPCLLQEFCPDNDGDIRINVIGDHIIGYKRLNRYNDFRASGSGKIVYLDVLPLECIEMAYKISKENNFNCMCYDFVQNSKKQWVLLECSYTFVPSLVNGCKFAYVPGKCLGKFCRVPNDYSAQERIIRTLLP